MADLNTQRPRLIVLDTNIFLDLAAKDDTVLDCLETVKKRLTRCTIIVPPTAIQELAHLAFEGDSPTERDLATTALRSIRDPWDFHPMTCVPVGNGIVEAIARKIRHAGLIPEEEVQDSFIVAESALANATLLISSDRHINELDLTELKIILDGCDVGCPLIASPLKIVRGFFR